MKKNKMLYMAPSVLFGLTIILGSVLGSVRVSAEQTAVDNVTVTVPEACTITTPSGSGQVYNVEMTNGQYKNNIGKTRLSVFCNNNESFAIYAVGYSGDTFGNTEMITSTTGATNIATGTATGSNSSDPSNWAMKLETVNGTGGAYTPNIISPFNNFAAVPSSYAKVAEVTSVTGATAEAAIDASYAVYLSREQAAGTYTGKVRYTVVHPSSAVPNQPYDTEAGKIGYYPNANGEAADTMGDQSIGASDTSATLWASNFKRTGYGFAGWSDKYDWVVNNQDENGNGTGPNAGHHIYGPNQTITTPSDLATKGLSLYAVWVKSQGTIQNWNGCGAMNVGEVTALTDIRDGNTYAIAKLRDNATDATSGKCWMIENLRLSNVDANNNAVTLSSTNTNNPSLPLNNTWWYSSSNQGTLTTSNSLSASIDPTASGQAWCITDSSDCFDQSMLFAGNTTNPANPMSSSNISTAVYSYGNYYNWYSATAGIGTYSVSSGNNATGSICPKGWHLPTGNTSGEFSSLDSAMGGTGAYQSTAEASNRWRTYPNNFVYSGDVSGSSVNSRGSNGSYWSSTANSVYNAYDSNLYSTGVYPGINGSSKVYGRVVRCVVGS